MNLESFISRYNGQQLTNNSGGFTGECVSLAARYAQEVQSVPNADGVLYCSNTGGARDLYEQFDGKLPQHYDRIPNGQPRQAGDLVIWGANLGHYGDVAVALDSGNRVFGQLGTPVFQPARIREENRPPLGYLRLKGSGSGGEVMVDEFTCRWIIENTTGKAPQGNELSDRVGKYTPAYVINEYLNSEAGKSFRASQAAAIQAMQDTINRLQGESANEAQKKLDAIKGALGVK